MVPKGGQTVVEPQTQSETPHVVSCRRIVLDRHGAKTESGWRRLSR